jgi:hypothetical protein
MVVVIAVVMWVVEAVEVITSDSGGGDRGGGSGCTQDDCKLRDFRVCVFN